MRILSFTFLLCLLAVISYGGQKETQKKVKPKRTDNYIRMKGIRLGSDISRPFQSLWTKGDRYGTEFSADVEFWPNLFPCFETGIEYRKLNTKYIDYKSSGSYSRIGIDYNILTAENVNDKNIVFIGLRYGFALANQQVNSYYINSYWTPVAGDFGKQNYSAHWGELLFGIKGEIIHNIYMGWTIRTKFLINAKKLDMPPAYFIPGFGKNTGFNADFTYSIYYNLPWDFRKSIDRKKAQIGTPATGKITKKPLPSEKTSPKPAKTGK
jgi:hypothetical protein